MSLGRLIRTGAKAAFVLGDVFLRPLPGPRILIYHQIGGGELEMEVTPEAFGTHIDWLQRRWEIVTLDQALSRRDEEGSESLLVLTFDDGYEGVYHQAFPLLRERRLPFTLYLSTQPIEKGDPLGYAAEPLTWEQLRAMAASGLMTVGAHTHRHRDLRLLPGPEIEVELDISNGLIRSRLGSEPRHFAYPWGYWSAAADPLVRERYTSAVLGSGPGIGPQADLFTLPRIPVQRSDRPAFFRRKVRTGLQLEDRARRLIKGYRGP
jgi:peptidoglycan/xylan/chitin deacetylase (PgdA/CDA1 family)